MVGKYTPLENHFRDLPANREEVTLSFAQIEAILAFKLPPSAFEDQRWWQHEREGNHVNRRAWTNAGWKLARVDVAGKHVKFVRSRK